MRHASVKLHAEQRAYAERLGSESPTMATVSPGASATVPRASQVVMPTYLMQKSTFMLLVGVTGTSRTPGFGLGDVTASHSNHGGK